MCFPFSLKIFSGMCRGGDRCRVTIMDTLKWVDFSRNSWSYHPAHFGFRSMRCCRRVIGWSCCARRAPRGAGEAGHHRKFTSGPSGAAKLPPSASFKATNRAKTSSGRRRDSFLSGCLLTGCPREFAFGKRPPPQVKFRNVLRELTAVQLDSGPATCMRVLAEYQKRPKIVRFSKPTKHADECLFQLRLLTRRAGYALLRC